MLKLLLTITIADSGTDLEGVYCAYPAKALESTSYVVFHWNTNK